jgi:hypothetical protein
LLLPLLLRRRQRLRCLSLLALAAGTAKAAAVVAVREALGGCGSVNGRKDGSKCPLPQAAGFAYAHTCIRQLGLGKVPGFAG